VDVLVVCRRLADFLNADETAENRCATEAEWARALELRRQGYNRYTAPPRPAVARPAGLPLPLRAADAEDGDGGGDGDGDGADGGRGGGDAAAMAAARQLSLEDEEALLVIDEADFAWPPALPAGAPRRAPPREASAAAEATAHAPTLCSIDLRLRPRTLTMVVGAVGSGKSSLLCALTNELLLLRGHVAVRGALALCAQGAPPGPPRRRVSKTARAV
jgi:ABC-type multidrug transport system fused ATPase/permease subunit